MRTVLLFGFLILFNHLSSLPKLYYSIHVATELLRIKLTALIQLSAVAAAFISVTQSPDGVGD